MVPWCCVAGGWDAGGELFGSREGREQREGQQTVNTRYPLPHSVFMSAFWIHESAVVIGDVSLGEDVSVWPSAVIRGDVERIVIGARSNVQAARLEVARLDPGQCALL